MQKYLGQLAISTTVAIAVAVAIVFVVSWLSGDDPTRPDALVVVQPAADAVATNPDTTTPDANGSPVIIDTFLMDDSGIAVMAGRTTPGGRVSLQLAGEVVATVTADARGSFATTVAVPADDQPRMLTILLDGVPTAQRDSIVIAPMPSVVAAVPAVDTTPPRVDKADAQTDADEASVVASQDNDTADFVPDPATAVTSDGEIAASLADTTTTAQQQVLAIDTDGVRVVSGAPQSISRVALDAITYDSSGDVVLSGRAPVDGTVQIYIDNRPMISATVAAQGNWRITLPDVDTGTYTLRIDEIDATGDVQSRLETPFRRSSAEDVAELMADQTGVPGFSVATRTVQPGTTLWAIARDTLGDGVLYVAVFEANRDLIRNPDLIYPGQVFRIPQAGGQSGDQ